MITRLRRLWFDFTIPKEWNLIKYFSHIILKLKDYDRMAYDYSCVLDHSTNGRMSKTNYVLTTIYSEIDSAQSEHYYSIVREDILDMMNGNAKNDEIKEYLNQLT